MDRLSSHRLRVWALVAGPAAALAVAVLTSTAGGIGLANAALLVGLVVVCAAALDRFAGMLASLVGAAAFNFLHTEPRNSFRISSRTDLVTVLLLLGIGAASGVYGALRVRTGLSLGAKAAASASTDDLKEGLTSGMPALVAWHTAVTAGTRDLALLNVSLVDTEGSRLPVVPRRSAKTGSRGDTVVVPAAGALVELADPSLRKSVQVTPRAEVGSVVVERGMLMAMVSDIELAWSVAQSVD